MHIQNTWSDDLKTIGKALQVYGPLRLTDEGTGLGVYQVRLQQVLIDEDGCFWG